MKIKDVEVGKLILGPMAGFTDMPFRALCREQGASFTYTEMISAKALYYKNRKLSKMRNLLLYIIKSGKNIFKNIVNL